MAPDIEPRKTPLLSGHSIEPFKGEEDMKIEALFPGHKGMIRIQPGGCIMTYPFGLFHDRIYNYKFRETDAIVLTYPKCGTTWMQEIVWTMRNNPNLDNPESQAPVNIRCPFLELDSLALSDKVEKPGPDNPVMQTFFKLCPDANPADGVFLQMAENIADPRTVKSHLPFSLLPADMLNKAKVVYVMRNPKDVVVSYLHHARLMKPHDYQGNLEQFVDYFIAGNQLYGQYDVHLKEAFERVGHKNLYIVKYEDLKADPVGEITKLDKFLGTKLTEKQIKNVVHFTSFEEMKKRDNVAGSSDEEGGIFNVEFAKKQGGFFRKGQAGDWKEKLTPELAARIDSWTKEKLGDTDVTFRYDI